MSFLWLSHPREMVKMSSFDHEEFARIADEVKESNQPMVITQNGEASMVIQSVKDYQQTQETLAMLKILSQSQKNVQDKNTISAKKAFATLRKRRGLNK